MDDLLEADGLVVNAKVSDDALIVDHAKFPEGQRHRHSIASVELFVDVHPDDDDDDASHKISMLPADGSFDRAFEIATCRLDTSGWAQGSQHVLYVRATDQGNQTGPVSAVYVTKN